jgi:Co/Zn/Cd efflux system component
MKQLGVGLAAAGVAICLFAIVRHFAPFVLKSAPHVSLIIGVVGLVVLLVGLWLGRVGKSATPRNTRGLTRAYCISGRRPHVVQSIFER